MAWQSKVEKALAETIGKTMNESLRRSGSDFMPTARSSGKRVVFT